MVYKCPRCDDDFETATNLRNHLKRKNICQPILQDIDIKDIIAEDCKVENDDEDHDCRYCGKTYSNKYNLEKHVKICKKNTANLFDKSSVEYLKQQIKEKDKEIKEKEKEIKELRQLFKLKTVKKMIIESGDKSGDESDDESTGYKKIDNKEQLLLTTQRLQIVNSILSTDQKIEVENKIKEANLTIQRNIPKNIPKPLRDRLWRDSFDNNPDGKCYVCEGIVTYTSFHAGHIISVKDGGDHNIDNLQVICQSCNTSMGSQNLEEFKKIYFTT
jgi:5-methylcytosine-specific restriction endonuclease McrA